MKPFILTFLFLISAAVLHAGNIRVYSYEPDRLLGTEYANDFRQAREGGQAVYFSVNKAKRLIRQCRPALVNRQVINSTQDNNFLSISKRGEATVLLTGSNMLIAPTAPGSIQLNLNPESGFVYYVPASRRLPHGLFILSVSSGGQID